MTLKDIAQRAGVSVSTVSRVLNDKDTKAASKEVSDRIWEIVRETGYVPNEYARGLRNKSRQSRKNSQSDEKKYFACVFARSLDRNDLFFAELARSVEFAAYKKGYILKCSFYANELNRNTFSSALKDQNISGIVVLGRFENASTASIINSMRNVVYVGLNPMTVDRDSIFCDGRKASHLAMETLLSLGHSRIAYIGETIRENRFQGYKETLSNNKIPYDERLVSRAQQTLIGGYEGATALMQQCGGEISAIFCANDATAMGCIKYLREQRIKVPEQMSVISIDDVEMSRYFMPMLTTIHIPIQELGIQAANILIDRIENGHVIPIKMELPFSLSNRESCARYSQKKISEK